MKLPAIYQNFFLRNLTMLLFFIFIIFSCTYSQFLGEPDYMERGTLWLLKMIVVILVPIYIAMTISNVLLVKGLCIPKKYGIFIPAFLLYWTCVHFFFVWYSGLLGIEKFKVLSTLSILSNGTGFYFLHLWITRNIDQGRKEIVNYASELSFLKQQLNPHFLLNAMNNLYGESLSEPENVPERILNLSDMLRYQIEASKRDKVPLAEEVGFIKRYIEYYTFSNDRLEVIQKYDGNFNTIQIPPLFLLPLVENAIKFSAETLKPSIHLSLEVDEREVCFSLQNNFLVSGSRREGTGIGIENLERRLEVYGLRHELVYTKEKDLFKIKLKLWGLSTAAL